MFLALTVVQVASLVSMDHRAAPFQLVSGSAYVLAWWLARRPERAAAAGAVMTSGLFLMLVCTFSTMTNEHDALRVAYFTSVGPLIAAATMRSKGVIAIGVVGAVALVVQARLSLQFGPNWWNLLNAAGNFYACVWAVAAASSVATNRVVRAHADQEQRASVAQAAARKAEARYELVAEHVSDLVSLLSADGTYLYASPSHERVLGVAPARLVGQQSPELVHPDDLMHVGEAFARSLSRGDTVTTLTRLQTASGDYRWFHLSFSSVPGAALPTGERAVAVSARDVTEQHELSEALEETRRMEALGSLAGGIAHDFNNLLMIVQSSADLAATQLPPEHPARSDLASIDETVQRAAALTQQLLTFARRQVLPSTARSTVARTAQELAPILTRLCGKNIRFSLDAPPSTRAIDASSVQVEQLLMNLAGNARDAMPGGGELRVGVRDRTLAGGEVPGLAPGPYVEVTVEDTGTGMTPEVQQRIFEPFYTTKAPGRGTGLGLATVFGLVTQLHGKVTLHSAVGEGTTFTLLLPAARPELPVEAPQSATGVAELALAILVIDDEAAVRTSVARMLRNAKHHVTTAESTETAMLAVEAPNAHFDAIVTDVMLGTDDGIGMLERIHRTQPHAAVVVMSGFSPSPERVAEVTQQGAVFLAKPFAVEALLEALRRARARQPATPPSSAKLD